MGLPCGVECVESAPGPLRRWSLFFNSLSEAIFFDFGWIWGGFGEAKWSKKSNFESFLGEFFSNAVLHRFQIDFWRLEN